MMETWTYLLGNLKGQEIAVDMDTWEKVHMRVEMDIL